MSMPSESWIRNGACWSGKPLPAATRKNLTVCWLSIHNWFAIPGSLASQRSPKSSSCASDWSRSNTCAPPSPMNNARSLATWSRTRFSGSKPATLCRTVASAFRRIHVPLVPTSAFAWDGRSWSKPLSYESQEQKTLVGLTSLISRNPPMLPKLNRKRALFVLTKIDEILAWEQRKEAERDTRFVELGRYLCEVRAGQYWRLEKLKSFDEFLERRFPESRRKAYYLMSIHEHLPPRARRELKQVGWTKGRELAKLARRMDRQSFD